MLRTTPQLPRAIESSDRAGEILKALEQRNLRLDHAGESAAAPIDFTAPVRAALLRARRTGRLVRGFDGVAEALAQERSGLAKLRQTTAQLHGERVSRVMLLSRDGSARLFNEAAALAERHAPRLLACVVSADSSELGTLLFGRDCMAKCILLNHKDAVVDFLLSLIA